MQQGRFAVWLALSGALVLNALSQKPASAAEHDIRVVSTQGMVQVQRAGAAVASPAQANQSLSAHDRIRTGQRSRALLRWSEDSTLRLADRTEVRILPPAKPGALYDVDAAQGFFYFFHRGKPGDLRVINRLVTAAIQGTEFSYEVDPNDGTTRIVMFDGAVELSNAFGTERITSGESAIVQPGQPPRRTAVLMGGGRGQWLGQWRDLIQWCLYYPAVLDVDEAGLAPAEQQALAESLAAYRQGDLLQALEKYPAGRQPAAAAETVYLAALILSVGDVKQAEEQLRKLDDASLPGRTETHLALADALRKLIASVKFQPWPSNAAPRLATEWMAESYQRQSQGRIDGAREAALAATKQAPRFGFAWARVAELEFSRGRTDAALKALDLSLNLSPRNAQALALRGFLLAAKNQIAPATDWFDQAIAIDPALGNAWLGRGLCRIRSGDEAGGREDLLVAASLEPQRSLLRSYLGKALANGRDPKRARHELELARHLDPADPTPWLYSALLNSDDNRINEGIRDLERSKELNDNRQVYRSRLLLDQDRSVKQLNLARIYEDAGMGDVAFREASRAVNGDYANYSAHLFLANSYDAASDVQRGNLRFETARVSEYLLANLLAPASAGTLTPLISQQEYSRMFEQDRLGLVSSTEYFSRGDWAQSGSQYGILGGLGYAVEASYRSVNGERPNNDFEERILSLQLRQQLTPRDSVYLQIIDYRSEGGDILQRWNPSEGNSQVRFDDRQRPIFDLGYHHAWSPAQHTLLFSSRREDTFNVNNPLSPVLEIDKPGGVPASVTPLSMRQDYRSQLEVYSAEAQHIWQMPRAHTIVGVRFQTGEIHTENLQTIPSRIAGNFLVPPADQEVTTDLRRISVYGYQAVNVLPSLQLIAGVAYDHLTYPENFRNAPISSGEEIQSRVSPKTGFIWTPATNLTLRGAYTRSLAGASLEQSVQLEPSQIAGFNQLFRSVIPEAVAGANAGAQFETAGLSLEKKFGRSTYVGLSGELLCSRVQRTVGTFDLDLDVGDFALPSSTREHLDFQERNLLLTLDRLLGDQWTAGARYRLTAARLKDEFVEMPANLSFEQPFQPRQSVKSLLQQVELHANFNHPSGWFGSVQALWNHQSNEGYTPAPDAEDFWQFNLFAGYRFPRRRAEILLGLLNLADQDYRLNPLTFHGDLPQERTFVARLRLNC